VKLYQLLVGGAITILKNMSSSVEIIIPNIWKKHVPNHQPAIGQLENIWFEPVAVMAKLVQL
jgi:hypothetical protein